MTNYYMNLSGSTYQILNSSLSVVYSGSSSSAVFNYMTVNLLSNGMSVYVNASQYSVDASWGNGSCLTDNNGISNITYTFSASAVLNAVSSLNEPVFMIYGCSNVIVNGGQFNGNGQNQSPCYQGNTSNGYGTLQSAQGIVIINCNNTLIINAQIYNTRVFGVTIGADGAVSGPFSSNGVANCTIYCTYTAGSAYTGWNAIQLGGTNTGGTIWDQTDYAINNVIYNWTDVGISMMSQNAVVTGNTIYNMYGENQDPGNGGAYWGGSYHGAQEGIVVEGVGGSGSGNYALIAGNNISNCGTSSPNSPGSGIGCASGSGTNYVFISQNTLNNCTIGGGGGNGAIYLSESAMYCQITYNSISNSTDGIDIASGCNNNNTYGNTYPTGVTNDYNNSGSGNTTTASPYVVVTVTSSLASTVGTVPATGVGAVTANGSYGVAGANSTSPYIFYVASGGAVALVANTISGYTFSSWSDSGAQTHTAYPSVNTTYTATYTAGGSSTAITLSPTSGPIDTLVSITGSNFAANSALTVGFYLVSVLIESFNTTTQANGAVGYSFYVPSVSAGTYTVTCTDASSNSASATFTVTSSAVSLPFTANFANLNQFTIESGTWTVGSSKLNGSNASADALIIVTGLTVTDCSVTIDGVVTAGSTQNNIDIVIRFTDMNNFYFLGIGGWGNQYEISKCVNGVYTELASSGVSSSLTQGSTYTIQVVIRGSLITLYVGGTQVLQVTDTSLTAGSIGVRTYQAVIQVLDMTAAALSMQQVAVADFGVGIDSVSIVDPINAGVPPAWQFQYWNGVVMRGGPAWVTLPDASLDHTLEELNGGRASLSNGQEELVFNLPNTAANRAALNLNAVLAPNVPVRIFYSSATAAPGNPANTPFLMFEGICTGAQYTSANLQCIVYNICFVALQQGGLVNLVYSGENAQTILAAIVPISMNTSCQSSEVTITFSDVSPWDACVALAQALGLDLWATGLSQGVPTVYIGNRSGNIVDASTWLFEQGTKRGIDRSKQVSQVIVRSNALDTNGNPIQGSASTGNPGLTRIFLDTNVSDPTVLTQIATQKLNTLNNPNSGTPLVFLTDSAYTLKPGMYVTINRPDLNLVGQFIVQRVTKGPVLTTVDIDVLVGLDDAILQDITNQIATLNLIA